ncbi:two-component sensor histidine kinase [Luteibacter sp. Sphag1AF]|uniref:sensor histidine kinase n=1 Tax=Luteibacter sp. Sphag1AF TaxID=2587031 RepID=UPI00161C7EDE|nr:histidine kinase [Luteibacter sp. Sphag1AF]MBB3226354.1 two-component sensor histidine kinase [Luteibacter sp. Sphag1AF]
MPLSQTLPSPLSIRRLLTVAALCAVFGALVSLSWDHWMQAVVRVFALGFSALLVFAAFERWPRRLPSWIARWVLQVVGVAIIIPLVALIIYIASTKSGAPPFWHDGDRMSGFWTLSVGGVLVAPWIALTALVRQKDALARYQALELDLQRTQLDRVAADAKLQLMQRQVAPHFLFNTLANIQALIDSGSPKSAEVMRNLVAYLRAAVPRLHTPLVPLADELALVRAYLALMHMRMPDRLTYSVDAEGDTATPCCPGLTLLTLVENAVKHGIDPNEEGGRITVTARSDAGRWCLRVDDTGAQVATASPGLGTGLNTLRDRLFLEFGNEAQLRMEPLQPRGMRAEVFVPVREVT